MGQTIRIGTRDSQLALWQANFVKDALEKNGSKCELVHIKSDGEIETVLPIYEIGIQGVFTKTLDIALLENKIDIAVHSLKDVPTVSPKGITITAIPKRGDHRDVIVSKNPIDWKTTMATVATSSIRRRAQWAYKYPQHSFDTIRGNINTRLKKLENHPTWDGVIFAAAGIQRINLQVPYLEILDWMIPAPAQGALGIAARDDDRKILDICAPLNHKNSEIATHCERQFLKALMGGCATPIAAFARVSGNEISIKANIVTTGNTPSKKEINEIYSIEKFNDAGSYAAEKILKEGGEELINEIRKTIG